MYGRGRGYYVADEMPLRGGAPGKSLVLRVAEMGAYWHFEMTPQSDERWKGTLLDGDRRLRLSVVGPSELQLREALDAYMGERVMPNGLNVLASTPVRSRLMSGPSCPYCQGPIPGGMPSCRKGACLTRLQMDLMTRGRAR